jgi:hypothetical protein
MWKSRLLWQVTVAVLLVLTAVGALTAAAVGWSTNRDRVFRKDLIVKTERLLGSIEASDAAAVASELGLDPRSSPSLVEARSVINQVRPRLHTEPKNWWAQAVVRDSSSGGYWVVIQIVSDVGSGPGVLEDVYYFSDRGSWTPLPGESSLFTSDR